MGRIGDIAQKFGEELGATTYGPANARVEEAERRALSAVVDAIGAVNTGMIIEDVIISVGQYGIIGSENLLVREAAGLAIDKYREALLATFPNQSGEQAGSET